MKPGSGFKECSRCRVVMPHAEFYDDARASDGLQSACKRCHIKGKRRANAVHMARARATDPEKFRARERAASARRQKNERTDARQAVHAALRSGALVRPGQCGRCGTSCTPTAHHPDYSQPLAVEWLCYPCHGQEHRHVA